MRRAVPRVVCPHCDVRRERSARYARRRMEARVVRRAASATRRAKRDPSPRAVPQRRPAACADPKPERATACCARAL